MIYTSFTACVILMVSTATFWPSPTFRKGYKTNGAKRAVIASQLAFIVNQPNSGEYAGMWVLLNERGKIERVYDAREEARRMAKYFDVLASGKQEVKSFHWDEPNVLAHVRFNSRTDEDGKNILFIEEIRDILIMDVLWRSMTDRYDGFPNRLLNITIYL